MKKITKSFMCLLLAFAMVLGITPGVVRADGTDTSVDSISITNITTNSFTVSFTATNCVSYVIHVSDEYDTNWTPLSIPTTETSYNVTGLNHGSCYKVYVEGFNEAGQDYSSTRESVRTLIVPVENLECTRYNVSSDISNVMNVEWINQKGADGYKVELLNYKGKIIESKDASQGENDVYFYVKPRHVYKARVTAIQGDYTTEAEEILVFEEPSVNTNSSKITTVKEKKKKVPALKISWYKSDYADGYDIYVSNKRDSGYKKVKSVSGNKNSITIKKFNGKKISKDKKYYVYIVHKVEYKGKIVESPTDYKYIISKNKVGLS